MRDYSKLEILIPENWIERILVFIIDKCCPGYTVYRLPKDK